MKYILFLIIFLPFVSIGQNTLIGTYEEETEYGSNSLTFKENNEFEYKSSTCTKDFKGKGNFEIKNNHLKLFFSKADSSERNNFKIIERDCTDSNFITINVLDNNGSPIPFSRISIKDKTNRKKGHYKLGTHTTTEGFAKLDISLLQFPIAIEIRALGIEPALKINILKKSCPIITTYIIIGGPEVVEGRIESWKILKLDSNQIIVKPGDIWHLKKVTE